MIDTVRLKSPPISENLARHLESISFLRQGLDMITGDIVYQITTMQLKGTYDSKISIQIEQGNWEYNIKKGVAERIGSEYYIIVECSVNKLFYGHNVYGGSNDIRQLSLLIKLLEEGLSCSMPEASEWKIVRLDYSENFVIGEKNVYNFIVNLSNSYYGRRSIGKYGKTGLYFSGTTTTLKFYAKGKEFIKHDKKRLKEFIDLEKINDLQNQANDILRVEVEVKKKKIIYDKGQLDTIKNIDIEYYKDVYNKEVNKLIRLTADSEYNYKYDDVKSILFKEHSKSMANSLLGTWLKFSLEGEEKAKETMSKTTFYNHRKLLISSNCNWNNNIVEKKEDNIIDFLPYSDSKYQQINNHERLQLLFQKYEIA